MELAEWAKARQVVEALVIRAGRSRRVEDVEAARVAIEEFKRGYPERAYTLAAYTQAVDGMGGG